MLLQWLLRKLRDPPEPEDESNVPDVFPRYHEYEHPKCLIRTLKQRMDLAYKEFNDYTRERSQETLALFTRYREHPSHDAAVQRRLSEAYDRWIKLDREYYEWLDTLTPEQVEKEILSG